MQAIASEEKRFDDLVGIVYRVWFNIRIQGLTSPLAKKPKASRKETQLG